MAEVLRYVQYDPKQLTRRLESWVKHAIEEKRITSAEGEEFLNNYSTGLYGYTYLEFKEK